MEIHSEWLQRHGLIFSKRRLTGINAASLGLALIANLALLLNMARRLSFAVAQTVTIAGFYVAAFLLIGLLGAAGSSSFRIAPADRHALSQAFYYGIIAAGLYIIIASLMVITVWGAYANHYEKEFRLTVSQRTLMLQTIMFMIYLLLGACIYTYIESWQYLDAVYWADFTLLTIGIGTPFTPQTHLGRSLLFPYAIGGIITVGLVVGSVRSLVLERGKAKMDARMTEKRREAVLKTVNHAKQTLKIGLFRKVKFNDRNLPETARREQEFKIMRKIQKDTASRRRWISLSISVFAACLLWFIGALVFWYSEQPQGWSYFVSLYFAYTSLLTIGYGDFQPQSNSGKPFFVFWTLLAVPTLTILISNMGDTVVKGFSDITIWLGSITVLPGEGGVRASIKGTVKNARLRLVDPHEFHLEQPPGLLRHSTSDAEKRKHKRELHIGQLTMRRVAQHLEDEELREATEMEKEGNMLDRDVHFYHFVLSRELRNLWQDTLATPPKQYDYSEWAYYLKLLGEDESNPELHTRRPPIKPRRQRGLNGKLIGKMNIGDAGMGTAGEDGGGSTSAPDSGGSDGKENGTEDDKMNSMGKPDDPMFAWGPKRIKWSWLGPRSPLMANKSEAEWLLERLCAVLETELRQVGIARAFKKPLRKPPFSMTELVMELRKKEAAEDKKHEQEEGDGGEGDEDPESRPSTR